MKTLEQIIADAEAAGATVGLSVRRPDGTAFDHNADQAFPSASTVKIAIMIGLFRRVDAGQDTLDTRRTFTDADRTTGSGVMTHMDAGMALTLRDINYLMMSISDNAATNILIDHVGMQEVNAVMRSLGMPRSVLGRPMRGRLALPGETENIAYPGEYATMVQALLDNRAASAESCAAMLGMMEKQQNDRRIARHLPRGEARPRWGSKTGTNPGVVNDVGYIFTQAGPVVIAAFLRGVTDPLEGERIIGDLARAAIG